MRKRYRVEPGKTLRSVVTVSSTNVNLLYNMDTLIKRHAGLDLPRTLIRGSGNFLYNHSNEKKIPGQAR